MQSMKEEMDRLRSLADDRERLSMTTQSMEDRLKEKETQVNILKNKKVNNTEGIPPETRLTITEVSGNFC